MTRFKITFEDTSYTYVSKDFIDNISNSWKELAKVEKVEEVE